MLRRRITLPLLPILICCPSFALAAQRSTQIVIVQPILVRGDDGQEPAAFRIREKLIDQVYGRGGIAFHFVDPITFDNSAARDGKKSLDEIVRDARRTGKLRGDGEMINMFFVNAVDGRPGPLGRGRQNGGITFIALSGGSPAAMEAFVVAHEAGHNLGLIHAVDDPNVPDKVPNLMGDGPYQGRVGPDGLTDYQFDAIRRSPLVHKRIECLSLAEARQAIINEAYEPYFARLQRREIAALTGRASAAAGLDQSREEGRRRFQDAVVPFSEREAEAVAWYAKTLTDRLNDSFPLFAQQPWRFLKIENRLCGGFPHTRGLCIIFSQRIVDGIVRARNAPHVDQALQAFGPLFVHEQMHVLQRFFPGRFAELYRQQMGFIRGRVACSPWLTQRQILNPDALDADWVVPVHESTGETSHYWMRTLLRGDHPIPRMGQDFWEVAVSVTPHKQGYRVVEDNDGQPVLRDATLVPQYLARLPIRRGLDHPNESTAYAFEQLVLFEHLMGPEMRQARYRPELRARLKPIREWALENLR